MRGSEFDEVAFFRAIQSLAFEDLWQRRKTVALTAHIDVHLPALEDLVLTKRFVDRPKDLEDIRLLRTLAESRS